MYCLEDW